MTPVRPHLLVVVGVALVIGLGLGPTVHEARVEEEKPSPATVEAVLYEVFHGDTLHRMGFYIREIYVPERDFSFNVVNGELHVFRPQRWRYPETSDGITIRLSDGTPMRLPVFHVPGTEPKRVRAFQLPVKYADQMEAHLREKIRLRALADSCLLPADTYKSVVAWRTSNRAVGEFVSRILDEGGITWVGVGNAGGENVSVPAERAEEARRLLREALIKGLHNPPADVEREASWDRHLDYRVIGEHGYPDGYGDRTKVPPAPPHADVLGHLQRFPGSEVVTTDGTKRYPKYGDHDLEQAEVTLRGLRARPWTVDVVTKWYGETAAGKGEEKVRAALVYLLAASRNAAAVHLVGAALADDELDVRVAATYGILNYWDEEPMEEGGTESAMLQAEAWWEKHRAIFTLPR